MYHLLQTATGLCHYYERHMLLRSSSSASDAMVSAELLFSVLFDYSIYFSNAFLEGARELCYGMLRRYSVPGVIEVPVPRYRGFHVRPTTLIAKIVHHYGAEVQMKIEDEEYDASIPFDLFRANEKLNAQKRRHIAAEALNVLHDEAIIEGREREELVRAVARRLFERRKLVLYDRALTLDGIEMISSDTPEECVVHSLHKLLTLGKIDVELDAKATFLGDKRVLADIELLANQNYGEDDFGNNLALPPTLSYLRK